MASTMGTDTLPFQVVMVVVLVVAASWVLPG
jgi:hypothetical protein